MCCSFVGKRIVNFLLDAEKTFSKHIRSMSNIDHSRSTNEFDRKVGSIKEHRKEHRRDDVRRNQ
jgi:hypothetical protein